MRARLIEQHAQIMTTYPQGGALKKLIITVRPNEWMMRGPNPHIPYTPDEIAEDAAQCRDAGAAIMHVHARLRFGWHSNPQPSLEGQPLFQQQPNGWDWIAPLGDGRCAWVKLREASTGAGMDYTWRIRRDCAGPGYFLLGDAACLMDPSAANGVLRAMMSGMYAAHLIHASALAGQPDHAAATEFRRWTGELYDRTRAHLSQNAG